MNMAENNRITFSLDMFNPQGLNINEGAEDLNPNAVLRLPSIEDIPVFSLQDYTSYWTHMSKSRGGTLALAKDFAASMPPYTQSFGRMSFMPNNTSGQLGILQWPGLPPETLQKLAREMAGVQMIINQRMSDVMRFAEKSDHPWRPGWTIAPVDPKIEIDDTIRRDIRKAEDFVLNSGFGKSFNDPLYRDSIGRKSFSQFMIQILRDSLTYDGMAVWTDCDEEGAIESYAPMPAGKIRLLARPDISKQNEIREGQLNFYGASTMTGKQEVDLNGDPINIPFAVAVDETNNIVDKFTRRELLWYTRNSRDDAEVGGYGFPEIEQALILVTGFQNALQFNADIFDKNSIPKGILAIKGNFTQRQFDALGRIWDNLQRGSRTDWTLPAIQLSEKGEIEVINLEPLRKEPAYYNNLINLFMGALATMYCIPVHRLGYKISGTERDSRPDTPKSLEEEEDVGLPALLTHFELFYNGYILSNRFPHLKFYFTGKSPKEDARLYEAKMLSMTLREKRKFVQLPSITDTLEEDASELEQLVARLMDNAPVDPGMAGIYQSVLAALAKGGAFGGPGEGGEGGTGDKSNKVKTPGAKFPSKKDPAKAETHGHVSGIRRDSAKERESAGKKKMPPNLRRLTASEAKPDTTGYTGSRGP